MFINDIELAKKKKYQLVRGTFALYVIVICFDFVSRNSASLELWLCGVKLSLLCVSEWYRSVTELN